MLETSEIEEKVNNIITRYALNYSFDNGKPKRYKHDGMLLEDERKAEIGASGLFELIEKIDYIQEIRNNASQYLKIKISIPEFSSILDVMDDKIIEKMNNDIEAVINEYGGFVSTSLKFTLYITKKIV